jgi:hypothetical protein
MIENAKFIDPEHTRIECTIDGQHSFVHADADGHVGRMLTAYLVENTIADYVAPPRPPRTISRKQWFYGLELRPEGSKLDAYTAYVPTTSRQAQIYWEAEDRFLESNSKVKKALAALGLDVAAFFDFASLQ